MSPFRTFGDVRQMDDFGIIWNKKRYPHKNTKCIWKSISHIAHRRISQRIIFKRRKIPKIIQITVPDRLKNPKIKPKTMSWTHKRTLPIKGPKMARTKIAIPILINTKHPSSCQTSKLPLTNSPCHLNYTTES